MKAALDPGHGMGNIGKPTSYDTGAVAGGVEEATIAMDWVNELRAILLAMGHKVIRTRKDALDPAPVGKRAKTAKDYGCSVMLSIHANEATGKPNGTETYYRDSSGTKDYAKAINAAVVSALGTLDRGVKMEGQSQYPHLAVLNFKKNVLVELGFLDNPSDRARMLNPVLRKAGCEALARVMVGA